MPVVSPAEVALVALDLEPELTSVRRARQWLGAALAGQPEERLDTAVLLASELVTNAILYAPGPVRMVLTVDPGYIRLEVHDVSEVEPFPKNYENDALTGRGLALVAALSDSWGVDGLHRGKSVWFELGGSTPPTPHSPPRPSPSNDIQGDGAEPDDMVPVVILNLPPTTYIAAEQHNDDLIREFALISKDDSAPSLPRRLLDLVAEIETYFGPQVSASRTQIAAAVERGDTSVVLHIRMHPRNRPYVERVVTLLDEADLFCRQGELLTLAASEEVLRFRAWYLGQVLTQLDGGQPSAWPY